jgi:hypothetical protein
MFVAAPFTPGSGPFGFGFGLGDVADVLRGLVGGRDGGPPQPEPIAELALPRKERAPTGKKLGKPKRVKELKDKRTAYSRYYLLSDGRTQAEVSAVPRHYPDNDGDYRPIDTAVPP